MVNLVVLE